MALPVVERTARCLALQLMARLACQLAGQVLLAPAAGAASPGPPAAASTPAAAPRITLHANMNNVAGSPWRESEGSVKYLGLYNTSEQCAWACMRGPPPRGSGHCCAFTFHTKDYEPDEPGGWNRQCFGVTNGHWVPAPLANITSGRVKWPAGTAASQACSQVPSLYQSVLL